MARANTSNEVIHDLRSVGYYADSGTATTLSAEEAAGQTDLGVASEAGFSADDVLRVGTNGSNADIGVVASTGVGSIVVDHGIVFTQASGAAVTKLTFTDMGATSDAGVVMAFSGSETALPAGTQVNTVLYMSGPQDQQINFSLIFGSPENFAQALGLAEATYVETSPAGVTIPPSAIASLGYKPWRFQGLNDAGSTVTFYIFAAKIVVPNTSLTFTTGQAMEIQMQMRSIGPIRMTIE